MNVNLGISEKNREEITRILNRSIIGESIWQYLDRREGETSSEDICPSIKAPREMILMTLGWLAREAYVLLTGALPHVTVKINPQPPAKGK